MQGWLVRGHHRCGRRTQAIAGAEHVDLGIENQSRRCDILALLFHPFESRQTIGVCRFVISSAPPDRGRGVNPSPVRLAVCMAVRADGVQ